MEDADKIVAAILTVASLRTTGVTDPKAVVGAYGQIIEELRARRMWGGGIPSKPR